MTKTTKTAAILLTFALLAVPVLAADLADVEIGSSRVSFYSTGERLSLDVTGPQGFNYAAEPRQGGLVFEIYDADGNLLPDGIYNYELKAIAGAPKASERNSDRGLGQKSSERLVQSGVFTIAGGSLVDPTAVEVDHSVAQKLVHAEDVKIQGSLCVGVDCTSSENFGFDTVRLKENNLRIKFDDTSTGSFPSNDWQLTANDSANGGQNRFSIDDVTGGKTPFTIEAGAPSNSLYVADSGEVGIGTSTPVSNVEVHVKDGDTPTLRLEQDGSSGFTAQTWDVAGNEANFFIRDVNHSSHLPFRIQPGSGNDNALYIASDGDVGFGTTSPGAQIHVSDTAPVNMRLQGDSAGYQLIDNNGPTNEGVAQQFVNGGEWRLRGLNDALTAETAEGIVVDLGTGNVGIHRATADATNPLTVGTSGSDGNGAYLSAGGTWTSTSSRALKHHIRDLETADAMAALEALNPVRYEYKIEPGEEYVGFIAEDVPDLVATHTRKHLTPMDIVAVLTQVVKEQQRTIEELSGRLDGLEAE